MDDVKIEPKTELEYCWLYSHFVFRSLFFLFIGFHGRYWHVRPDLFWIYKIYVRPPPLHTGTLQILAIALITELFSTPTGHMITPGRLLNPIVTFRTFLKLRFLDILHKGIEVDIDLPIKLILVARQPHMTLLTEHTNHLTTELTDNLPHTLTEILPTFRTLLPENLISSEGPLTHHLVFDGVGAVGGGAVD